MILLMKLRQTKIYDSVAIILVLFTVVCRLYAKVADMYAVYVYPHVSAVLSWLSSFVSFGVQEIIIALITAYAVYITIKGIRYHHGWKRIVLSLVRILAWTYIWFYLAWCINYSRSAVYQRTSEKMTPYSEVAFKQFVNTFISESNACYIKVVSCDKTQITKEIKEYYSSVPSIYGLCATHHWQQPKYSLCNTLYSSVSVLGFMAPLLSESYINSDLPDVDYPFTYAHELSHLLGVSSEAEANWWAFHACASSSNAAIRYSAYKGILPYVLNNASMSLSEQEYKTILGNIRSEVIEDVRNSHAHWQSLQSPVLRKLHSVSYDLFLKGNNITKGVENYSEVVALLINLKTPTE